MSFINKVGIKIETAKTEPEEIMNTILDELKTEIKYDNTTIFKSLDMKISALTSNKPSYFYDQPFANFIQWPLLKSPEKSSYGSQFAKRLYFITPYYGVHG